MPMNLTAVDVFTDPVVVPEDGDDRIAASVTQAFQALANRTLNSKARLDLLEPRVDDHDIAVRRVMIPLEHFRPMFLSNWSRVIDAWMVPVGGVASSIECEIRLPVGTVISRVRAYVEIDATVGSGVGLNTFRKVYATGVDTSDAGTKVPVETNIGSYIGVAGITGVLNTGAITVDNVVGESELFAIRFEGKGAAVYWVEMFITERAS